MSLADVWDKLMHRRTRSPVSLEFPVDGAPEIEAEAGYFQVRVAEMYLEYERELLQKLAPATLCVCDFKYGAEGKEIQVPFFVSNQMFKGIAEGGGNLDKVRIRLRDTRVLGPVPYRGGEVGLFAGLYRTVIEDERKALFSLFDKLLGATQMNAFAPYVAMAEKISDELSVMLGMDAVQCLVAERQVFRRGTRPLRGGYLALLDCEAAQIGGLQLAVEMGCLRIVEGGASRPFDLCNYCLLQMDTSDTRDDVTTLPFHQKWKEARSSLMAGDGGPARAALLTCQRMLLDSDDLTEDHRNKLLEFYQAAFVKEQQRLEAANGLAQLLPGEGHRGARDAAGEMRVLADLANEKPRLEASIMRIRTLVDADGIPAQAGQGDGDWEAAIRGYLRSGGKRGDRATADMLAATLASAAVAH